MVAFMGQQYLYKYVRYKGHYTRYCIKYSSNNISIFFKQPVDCGGMNSDADELLRRPRTSLSSKDGCEFRAVGGQSLRGLGFYRFSRKRIGAFTIPTGLEIRRNKVQATFSHFKKQPARLSTHHFSKCASGNAVVCLISFSTKLDFASCTPSCESNTSNTKCENAFISVKNACSR